MNQTRRLQWMTVLLFFLLLTFLASYSWHKLRLYAYQRTIQMESATPAEVKAALQGMTAAGDPAVPALTALLQRESDAERGEWIAGALLRMTTPAAQDAAEAYLEETPDAADALREWLAMSPTERSSRWQRISAFERRRLRLASADSVEDGELSAAVDRLNADSVLVRQEALDRLMTAAGHNAPGYDAVAPDAAAIAAWQAWVEEKSR